MFRWSSIGRADSTDWEGGSFQEPRSSTEAEVNFRIQLPANLSALRSSSSERGESTAQRRAKPVGKKMTGDRTIQDDRRARQEHAAVGFVQLEDACIGGAGPGNFTLDFQADRDVLSFDVRFGRRGRERETADDED